jgi:selenophosphate synthetase-related protein
VNIHASKDVTKGGLISAVYEVCEKSGRTFELSDDLPFSLTRNLDNFLVCITEDDKCSIERICEDFGVSFSCAGRVG